ncbi:vacuolar protein sorting-associated protein 62 [Senna tora]|uniref:Vacuolar protein sorting-associated protein 62 n=1 Tax=Senna tora TaxID=362788 RepID=A0A834WEB5_9FABA|nr:vacuolar protein sorting-associated protein 62 [Senna tora]
MFGGDCFCWNSAPDFYPSPPQPFSLPSPLPEWPPGGSFASGRICLGEIEVSNITKFERVWSYCDSRGKPEGLTFYRPVEIPDGFFCLGHYCQSNQQPLRGYFLVARQATSFEPQVNHTNDSELKSPALKKPLNYSLIWSTDSANDVCGYFWLPNPPLGYKAMGIVVTSKPEEPKAEEVRCVRADLTETCETCDALLTMNSKFSKITFHVWNTRPCKRGALGRGVSIGTFYGSTYFDPEQEIYISCLKNLDPTLKAMPNLHQIHALIEHYGPTVYFHPDEVYLPSSVRWFFKNGALLYAEGSEKKGKPIDYRGSNLPSGGTNDGAFWIDLPSNDDNARNDLKKGNIESAELYVHVKPALGGTFSDIAMWVFCPFNGPATIKVGIMNIALNKIGEHVGDWEHFTLRVSNFTGELWSVFFSQHSGGEWVDAFNLEFIEGNKPIVYSSKNGHASFPHPGTYLQGSSKLGIGVRNDAARSNLFVDSSTKYQIVAAEYLGDGNGYGAVEEPCWLQYMREWGPTIFYESRSEIKKLIDLLPFFVRFSLKNIFELFPTELYSEEGPTGPKEKANWEGDEICTASLHHL